ncbi:hypothetical protein [Vibrio sp. 10N.261.46.A3]|uniref:hypothetical protein n=1 Tax=Vibrio sp. 10N.261.46.A3 TaxID=3229658 RepID=UPI00354E7E76
MNTVYAVYIVFNPDLSRLKKSVLGALEQVDKVIIYMNSYIDEDNVVNSDRVEFIGCCNNDGVSGMNAAISWALDDGADYVVIQDQDSLLPKNYISDSLPHIVNSLAVVAPQFYDKERSRPSNYNKSKFQPIEGFESTKFVIGSGMLLSRGVINICGLFEGKFFLDCVDIEYCFRLNYYKIPIYVNKNAVMEHSIGDDCLILFGIKFSLHSPFRHYLYYKNSLSLISRGYTPLLWKVKQTLKITLQWLIYTVFSKDKLPNFKAFPLAFIDLIFKKDPLDRLNLF